MPVITYRQALNNTLSEELARDPNVVLMGEEIGKFQGSYRITEGLLNEFGKKRVVDTPISEEGFVGLAVGAAMLGLRPVVEIMTINLTEKLFFFVAEYTKADQVTAGGGVKTDGEEIEVLEIPFEQAMEMIETGEIVDGKTIMLLQYAKIHNLLAS